MIHGHKTRNGTSPEYKTWLGIKRRCSDEKCKDYPRYGGRGIRVSAQWDRSFVQFLKDMGLKPSPVHQIDRKDSKGDYEAGNCRWVTPQIQGAENKSSLITVDIDGLHFHSLKAACRHFGVKLTTALYRLNSGIPLEDALHHNGPKRMKSRRTRESYLSRSHPDRL